MHASTLRIRDLMTELGLQPEVRQFDESTRTAVDAANVLGCEVGAIASSLVFLADGSPILVLTSGAHRVDTDLLATQIGAQEVTRASADEVRGATGQPIGGVAPVGHPAPVPTYLDLWLQRHDLLWCAAGTPQSVMSVTYAELLQVTGATEVDVEPPEQP